MNRSKLCTLAFVVLTFGAIKGWSEEQWLPFEEKSLGIATVVNKTWVRSGQPPTGKPQTSGVVIFAIPIPSTFISFQKFISSATAEGRYVELQKTNPKNPRERRVKRLRAANFEAVEVIVESRHEHTRWVDIMTGEFMYSIVLGSHGAISKSLQSDFEKVVSNFRTLP